MKNSERRLWKKLLTFRLKFVTLTCKSQNLRRLFARQRGRKMELRRSKRGAPWSPRLFRRGANVRPGN